MSRKRPVFRRLHNQDMTNVAGIIAITRQILRDEPLNARARQVVAWADALGHTPTDAEFEAFCRSKGIWFVEGNSRKK